MGHRYANFSELVGKTLEDVVLDSNKESITFKTSSGTFVLYHDQDCCETVLVEEVIGDLSDLRGLVLEAEEVIGDIETDEEGSESQWTFYKVATAKGFVTIRWFGSNSGYYAMVVAFKELVDGVEDNYDRYDMVSDCPACGVSVDDTETHCSECGVRMA